jgi:hypothetical protein
MNEASLASLTIDHPRLSHGDHKQLEDFRFWDPNQVWNGCSASAVVLAQGDRATTKQSPAGGDERTPEKPLGEIAYAENPRDERPAGGGAGKPQAGKVEPENQGGIGGP